MKIKCPRCKSKLEVEAVGQLVSCPYCLLEFNVEEPKKRNSIWFILTNFNWSKINWFKLAAGGLSIFLGIFFVIGIATAFWLKSKNPQALEMFQGFVGGITGILIGIILLAFLVLLVVNIILWVFLPLMVYSIKQSVEEAVREIKNLKNS
jgi:hypothetical protein